MPTTGERVGASARDRRLRAVVSHRFTPKKRVAFLEALAATGNVRTAARAIKMTARALYYHRRKDPSLLAAWEQALQEAMDTVLEPEAFRRAVEGVLKPVYQGGEQVGTVREYSDTLLIFLLKGGKKEKYAERRETIYKGMLTLLHKMEQMAQMSPEEREALLGEIEAYVTGGSDHP